MEDQKQPAPQLVKVTQIKKLPDDCNVDFSIIGTIKISHDDIMKILHHWIYRVYLVDTLELQSIMGMFFVGNTLYPKQRIIAIKISNKELTDQNIFDAAIKMPYYQNIEDIVGSIISKQLIKALLS